MPALWNRKKNEALLAWIDRTTSPPYRGPELVCISMVQTCGDLTAGGVISGQLIELLNLPPLPMCPTGPPDPLLLIVNEAPSRMQHPHEEGEKSSCL